MTNLQRVAEGVAAWLLHRFGPNTPEAREAETLLAACRSSDEPSAPPEGTSPRNPSIKDDVASFTTEFKWSDLEPSEGPASLVDALQDVVHTDPEPVKPGRAEKSSGNPAFIPGQQPCPICGRLDPHTHS